MPISRKRLYVSLTVLKKLVLQSYAKLNLYLAVLSRRKDGFHDISTIFERISLCDTIALTLRPGTRITLTCRGHSIPQGPKNICYKAARLLQAKYRVNKGAHIRITKRIPVGAGLGGGSSNAATTLAGLNSLWKLGLSVEELASCASEIGSDVPFFVHGAAWAHASGRGEKVVPLKKLGKTRLWHLLVVPRIHVPTPLIYKAWDQLEKKRRKGRLTSVIPDVTMLLSALQAGDFPNSGPLFNNLEPVTIRLYPEVGVIKDKLLALGARYVQMSGSGSSVFSVAGSCAEAKRLRRRLGTQKGSLRAFVVRTI